MTDIYLRSVTDDGTVVLRDPTAADVVARGGSRSRFVEPIVKRLPMATQPSLIQLHGAVTQRHPALAGQLTTNDDDLVLLAVA